MNLDLRVELLEADRLTMSTAKKQEAKILQEMADSQGSLKPQNEDISSPSAVLKLVKPQLLEPESMGRILAHDLANHLNVLTLSISRLEGQNEVEKKMLERARLAMQNMAAQISIARDILVAEEGRIPLKIAKFNLNQVVEDAITEFKTSRHYLPTQIELKATSPLKSVLIDSHHFAEKIFNPLLSNAIRFSPKDGIVRIEITEVDGRLELKIQNQSEELPLDWIRDFFSGSKRFIRQGRDLKKGLGLSLRLIKTSAALLRLDIEVKNQPAPIHEAGQFMTEFIIRNFETMV